MNAPLLVSWVHRKYRGMRALAFFPGSFRAKALDKERSHGIRGVWRSGEETSIPFSHSFANGY